jgi:hypothetical protein
MKMYVNVHDDITHLLEKGFRPTLESIEDEEGNVLLEFTNENAEPDPNIANYGGTD